MVRINLKMDEKSLTELKDALKLIGEQALPNTAEAFQVSIRQAKQVMNNYIAGMGSLDGIGMISKPFNPSKANMQTIQNGNFDYKISVESKELSEIQNGKSSSDFDMKTKYPYGKKSRVSKKGIPYLIIPFRWGTSKKRSHFNNFIPQADYRTNVKPMNKSSVLRLIHKEPNANGELINRVSYIWGDRLKNGLVSSPVSRFTGLNYSAGMVRMAAGRKSTYFTFRIISAKSPKDSWIRHIEGVQPVDIESAWAKTVKDAVIDTIQRGIMADLS